MVERWKTLAFQKVANPLNSLHVTKQLTRHLNIYLLSSLPHALRLESELKWAKTEGGKKELFGTQSAKPGGGTDGMSAVEEGDQMLRDAEGIQDKTEQSLIHSRQMVEATKEVGQATIEELHRQRNQIKDITEEVMQIEDNLARADKLIRTFGRRMATDKFIQCFACVNILLLVGVITYAVVSKKDEEAIDNAPDTPF
jgi:SNARE protein